MATYETLDVIYVCSLPAEVSVPLYELISFSEYQITIFGLLEGFDEGGATSAYINTREAICTQYGLYVTVSKLWGMVQRSATREVCGLVKFLSAFA